MIYIMRFFKWLWEKLSGLFTLESLVKGAEVFKEQHPEVNKKIEDVIRQVEVGPDEPISWEEELEEEHREEPIVSDVPPQSTIEEITLPKGNNPVVQEFMQRMEVEAIDEHLESIPELPVMSFSSPVSGGFIGASFTQVTRMKQTMRVGSSWIG